jgi:thiamine-monophosphate kinase
MANKSGDFTEAQVISRLREIFATSDPRVQIGIGDDAAVVAGTDKRQVMTTDMAVEGIHFRTDWSTAYEIGRKVTAANAADILAMGATPDYLLVAVALTGSENIEWIEDLARGIKFEADLAGLHVVGGDLSRSQKIVISMSAIGHCDSPVTRIGAKSGDGIYLSSLTGWSAAGLAILDSKFNSVSDACAVAVREYKNPTIDYGFDSSGATSMSDVSDAMAIQAAQMADSSKVAFKFDLSKIQASAEFAELEKLARELEADVWKWVFAGGEDHALLATGRDLPGILIGEVIAGAGIQNVPADVETSAWQHFK